MKTLDAARGKPYSDESGTKVEESQPGYYALLPLAMVGDAATLPIQAPIYIFIFFVGQSVPN